MLVHADSREAVHRGGAVGGDELQHHVGASDGWPSGCVALHQSRLTRVRRIVTVCNKRNQVAKRVSYSYQRNGALEMEANMGTQQWLELSETEQYRAINAMQCIGGGFAVLIGKAWMKADLGNRRKLDLAFADLFLTYRDEQQ